MDCVSKVVTGVLNSPWSRCGVGFLGYRSTSRQNVFLNVFVLEGRGGVRRERMCMGWGRGEGAVCVCVCVCVCVVPVRV